MFQSLKALIQSSHCEFTPFIVGNPQKKSSGHLDFDDLYIFFLPHRPKKPTPTHPHHALHGHVPWDFSWDPPHLPPPGPWKQSPTWNHDLGLHRCVWETQQNCHQKIHQAEAPPGRKHACQTVETNIVVSTNVGMDVRDDEEHVLRWRSPFSLKEWRRFWGNFYCKIIFFMWVFFPCLVASLFLGGLRVAFLSLAWFFYWFCSEVFRISRWGNGRHLHHVGSYYPIGNVVKIDHKAFQQIGTVFSHGHWEDMKYLKVFIYSLFSFLLKETKIIRWASTSYKWNYNPYRWPGGFMNTQVKQLPAKEEAWYLTNPNYHVGWRPFPKKDSIPTFPKILWWPRNVDAHPNLTHLDIRPKLDVFQMMCDIPEYPYLSWIHLFQTIILGIQYTC